ncbi:hypothetical protein [Xanthobacter flavus]|uniref:hypothetical protein n=1 Tax=Xanthobacter flavus TaxID=281 RepID=UPI003726AA8B
MVNLPEVPRRLALTEAPRSGITAADIAAPYAMFARAAGNLADAVQPVAEEQAAAAGAAAVGRDDSGNLVMTTGPAFGRLGEVYTRSARAAFLAQLDGDVDRKLLEMRQQAPSDPGRFDGMAKAFGDELVAREKDPLLKSAIRVMVDKGRNQHFIGMSREKQQVDLGNAKIALETRVKANDDKMSALARQGGTGTPEYQSLAADQKALYGELSANPQWGYNPTVVGDQIARGESRHKAEAFLGTADRLYQEKGFEEGMRSFETAIRDPGLNLTEAERNQYVSHGKAQMAAKETLRREDVKEANAVAQPLIVALRQGIAGLDDDAETTAKKLESLNDPAGAARIRAAAEYNRGMRGVISTPTRNWPGSGPGVVDAPKLPALATVRFAYSQELQNPAVRARLAALTHAEVGGQGPAAQQAFIETIMNRAAARGQTLAQTMTGSYFPEVTHLRTAAYSSSPGITSRYDGAITAALQGSNVGRFATGNASGTVGFAGGPQVVAHGGERFGIEGPDQAWAQRMGAAAAGNGDVASAGPPPAYVLGQQEGARKAWTAFYTSASATVGRWGLTPDDASWIQGVAPYLTPQQREQGRELFAKAHLRGALDALSLDQQNAVHASLTEEAAAGSAGAQRMLRDFEEMRAQTAAREEKDPMGRGIDAGWTQGPKAIVWSAPVDEVTAAVQQRGRDARAVASNLGRDAVPALQPSEATAFAGALRQNPALLATLESLDPATYAATMGLKPVQDALAGMARSNDYGKMSAAFGAYGKLRAADPIGFEKAFGTNTEHRLDDWVALTSYMTPQDAVAEFRKISDLPADVLKRRTEEASKNAPKVDKVLAEIGGAGSGGPFNFMMTPVNALLGRDTAIPPDTRDAMYSDYRQLYEERYRRIGDADTAHTQAMERLKKVWAPSPANDGRLMKNPPELRPEYPMVGGGKDYIAQQTEEALATIPGGRPAHWWLASDRGTQADITAGRPPSYAVAYVDKADGTVKLLSDANARPQRLVFDPAPAMAEYERGARARDVARRFGEAEFGAGDIGGAVRDLELQRLDQRIADIRAGSFLPGTGAVEMRSVSSPPRAGLSAYDEQRIADLEQRRSRLLGERQPRTAP